MKVTLESTDRIVEIESGSGRVPARVWEGTTNKGVECFALITRIAVHKDLDASDFERDLKEQRAPSPRSFQVFDTRLVL